MLHTPSGKQEVLMVPSGSGKPIPQVATRKLLGWILDEKLDSQAHIKFIAGCATSALYSISPIISHTQWDASLLLSKALVAQHLSRTYPIWCATKASLAPLEKVHRSMLLKCTKAFPSTSTAALEALTGTPPLDLILSETLCQEAARLQMHSDTDFPLLALIIRLASNQSFLTSNIKSPLHSMLITLQDLNLNPGNIEKLPTYTMHLPVCQPVLHKGPVIGKKKAEWNLEETKAAKKHVMDEVLSLPSNAPLSFTDGSALGNPGPCGAAAVVFTEGLAGEPGIVKASCSRDGNNYLGELWGLLLALMTFSLETVPLPSEVHIFTDCTAAIQCAVSASVAGYYEIVADIRNCISFLAEHQCQTHIHWTPSHIDIGLNEIVDQAAKEAAEEANLMDDLAPSTTLADEKRHIRRAITERWQRRWDRNHGQTRKYIRKVQYRSYKSVVPLKAEISRAGCITGHNKLMDHMHKLKLKPSAVCQCGQDRQTADHILMNCVTHLAARRALHDKIELIYVRNNVPTHHRIWSISNLLTPQHDSSTNNEITAATAEFLLDIGISI